MATAGRGGSTFLLLGGSGAGKTLLVKRLQKLSSRDGAKDLGEPPPTLPTVGTNLTDLSIGKRITVRELGGCMGPIWSSYYSDCCCVLYVIDAARPTQISSSCVQLLSLLSAEELTSVPVLIIFNKISWTHHQTPGKEILLQKVPVKFLTMKMHGGQQLEADVFKSMG